MKSLTAPAALLALLLISEAQAARFCRFSLGGFTQMTKHENSRDVRSGQNGKNEEIQTFIRDEGDKSTFYLYNVDSKRRYTYRLHDSPMRFEMRKIRMRYNNLYFVEETENIQFTHHIRIVNAQTGGLKTVRVPRQAVRLLNTTAVGDKLIVLEFGLSTGQRYMLPVRL